MTILTWLGIFFCISQSAILSGLNLAFFSISKMRLDIELKNSNKLAQKIKTLRTDSNFLLTTILWGNVGVNVLLTLLSKSVLAGVTAFIFSTFVITIFGEIVPQAYFSRHALRMAAFMSPLMKFYQFILYPIAKPSAILLDKWLGKEVHKLYEENELRELLRLHIDAPETNMSKVEGKGALNFLALDDLTVLEAGEPLDLNSVIQLEFVNSSPVFQINEYSISDLFLSKIQNSGKKWIILVDSTGEPQLTLDSDVFLRAALFNKNSFNPVKHCHRPIIIRDPKTRLGEAIMSLKVKQQHENDDVIDEDMILYWGIDQKRIITGSDLFGRLLRGIIANVENDFGIASM